MSASLFVAGLSCIVYAASPTPWAQGPGTWVQEFGSLPGLLGGVEAVATFDDGTGPALYVAGEFDSAGGQPALRIGRWDGFRWSTLGGGANGRIWALAVYDDGSGEALFAAGSFSEIDGVPAARIARWDGQSWSALGSGLEHPSAPAAGRALAMFDGGSGPELIVSGTFTSAGGVPAANVARWDGQIWSPLGANSSGGSVILALETFDDGVTSRLVAGGSFTEINGVAAQRLASWDGSSWSPMGQGANSTVMSLASFDAGAGPRLAVGGFFTAVDGVAASRVAEWNGSAWSALGSGLTSTVRALEAFPSPTGPVLVAGGSFNNVGGSEGDRVAQWNGLEWSALGAGADGTVDGLAVFDDGDGPALFAGGVFRRAGELFAPGVAKWSGQHWSNLGSQSLDGSVSELELHDDGTGPALYAGGSFDTWGTAELNAIGRWDGVQWSPLGAGLGVGNVHALQSFDDGSGPSLAAGGTFTQAIGAPGDHIAAWDGSAWRSLGLGFGASDVADLAVFDGGQGEQLIAIGDFTVADGMQAKRIARWDGIGWLPLGEGLGSPGSVLIVHDSGAGPRLIAGGAFVSAGGAPASGVASWDGSAWSSMGATFEFAPRALASIQTPAGPLLIAGGVNNSPDGVAMDFIAAWDGIQWSPLGTGLDGSVRSLAVRSTAQFDELVVSGFFEHAGGQPAAGLARWDGAQWIAMPPGSGLPASSMLCFDDGSGESLFAGGSISTVPDSGDAYVGRWSWSGASTAPRVHVAGSPVAPGEACRLTFEASGLSGVPYLAALSTAVAPEIPLLSGSPAVSGLVPLAWTPLLQSSLGGAAPVTGFSGVLDAQAQAQGAIHVPANPALAGRTVFTAFVALNPAPSPFAISGASAIQIQ